MKIAVVAANGRVAGKVIAEAVNRGFDVTAFGRQENNTQAQTYIQKDLFDLTKDDLKGFDAVVDAFGAWTEDTRWISTALPLSTCATSSPERISGF